MRGGLNAGLRRGSRLTVISRLQKSWIRRSSCAQVCVVHKMGSDAVHPLDGDVVGVLEAQRLPVLRNLGASWPEV